MFIDREIEATLRLLTKSLICRVKSSGLSSFRWASTSPLVSEVISTSGQPDIVIPHPASTVMLMDREIKATLRLLTKSLKSRVKSSGLASSRLAPPSPLVSDVISTSGQQDIDVPHPASIVMHLIGKLRLR